MGINNPLPSSLKSETKKAAKILNSFVKPNQVFGAEEVIPPNVLRNAKGLAILTVFKAGFLFSGRAGSGVVVSRLRDGTWSSPSAICLAGGGAGGMVGAELTDFVFILNTYDAVKSFSQFGSITLGGNMSVAAGPLGRSAEASASASMKGVAAVFAYSKTKGLFAGVSLEGSVLLERRETNRKVYGNNCTAKMILSGRVEPPAFADPLYRILDSKVFSYNGRRRGGDEYSDEDDSLYDDLPSSFGSDDSRSFRSGNDAGRSRSSRRDRSSSFRGGRNSGDSYDSYDNESDFGGNDNGFGDSRLSHQDTSRDYYRRARATSQSTKTRWEDDIYDTPAGGSRSSPQPSRPRAEKPDFGLSNSGLPKAVALYTFKGEQGGDLSFKKGDVIAIIKKSESTNDWWTGRMNGQEGIFPANYVELV